MRILFTGASSFTGYWFIKELTKRGHEVVSPCRKKESDYEGTYSERIKRLSKISTLHYDCEFGSDRFFRLLNEEKNGFDLFCHHAAHMTNYKSEAFDPVEALAKNICRLPKVLEKLQEKGCHATLLTGSNFEPNEGGVPNSPALSAYGLSKGLTSQSFSFYTDRLGIKLKKIVLPNTFGPLEESSRLTSSLIRSWQQGKVPTLLHPSYIRDNVPVDLLAKAYADFTQTVPILLKPSFYTENQGAFAKRLAKEMEKRLDISCDLILKEQASFVEPRIRINTDYLSPQDYAWDERAFWDGLASYFEKTA